MGGFAAKKTSQLSSTSSTASASLRGSAVLLLLLLRNLRSEVCGDSVGGGRLVDGRHVKRGLTAAG